MTALLTNPLFLIFGGGCAVAIVAIVSARVTQVMKMRMQERESLRQQTMAGEQALFGLGAQEDLRALHRRVDGIESQLGRLVTLVEGLAAGPAPTEPQARRLDPVQPTVRTEDSRTVAQ